MDKDDVHPSHEMEYSKYGSDDHDDRSCKTCHRSTCFLCRTGEGMDDDELAAPCLGYSRWDSRRVEGPDGLIRTVRKSGTGWPK